MISLAKYHYSLQAKVAIRELLPNGLRESISKVRSSVAYAVSAIAHWDWPEAWPQLFNLLMEMLVSGDLNAVHGAMRVLTGMCICMARPEQLSCFFLDFDGIVPHSHFVSEVKKLEQKWGACMVQELKPPAQSLLSFLLIKA